MAKFQPQRFGKYVLLRRIALGGMAEIFKAKVGGIGGFEKDVVIKRILPHFSEDEAFTRMFIDEARLTAKLQHQNIVQIFDFDVIDGRYFIAMEYIEGRDLKEVIERAESLDERLTVAQCVFITMEVARGLHYAHTREDGGRHLGIVHRDVTPSNIMISFRGDVKLMDFGIATAAQRTTKTQAGAVKGKIAYMSPEQAHGKPVDPRTDIFALGVVLWETLTGTRLFLAESDFETLTNIVRVEPKPPSEIDDRVPKELDAIVLKCLEKDQTKRWQNMDVLARELTRWYYANIPDIEREKLRPLIVRLFKPDIDANEQLSEQERTDFLGLSVQPASSFETTRHDASARPGTGLYVASALGPDDARTRTVSTIPAPDSTRVEGIFPRRPDVALAPRGPLAAKDGPEAPRRRRGWVLPVVVILLCGALGVGLAFVLWPMKTPESQAQPDRIATAPPIEPVAEATLKVVFTPAEATVTIDGQPSDGTLSGLKIGDVVRVVAEAPNFQRHESLVKIAETATRVEVALEKSKTPHSVVFRPGDEHDEVFVDDVRLGLGARMFEGHVGQKVRVRVNPASGGPPIEREIVLTPGEAIVAIATPGKIFVSLDPPEAELRSDLGTVDASTRGLVMITGVPIGQTITLKASAPGHTDLEKTVIIGGANDALSLALKRVKEAPTPRSEGSPATRPPTPRDGTPVAPGPSDRGADTKTTSVSAQKGGISVTATPLAQVTINGLPRGSTPVKATGLAPGVYRVVLSKGSRVETRSVTVEAGKEAKVFVDFSE